MVKGKVKVFRIDVKSRMKCGRCNSTCLKPMLYETEVYKYGIKCEKCGYENRKDFKFFRVSY